MKISNQKGFILTETMVVSVILMVAFLFVFSQFLLIFAQYREFESYSKVSNVYKARNMATFLVKDNYDEIMATLNNNSYFNLTTCSAPIEFTSYCEGLIGEMDIKMAILTPYDLQAVINNNPSDFSHRLKQYLKYLQKSKDNPGEYRIILELNDGTFSSYTIGSEYAYPTKQQYRYKRGYATFNGVTDYITINKTIPATITIEMWAFANTWDRKMLWALETAKNLNLYFSTNRIILNVGDGAVNYFSDRGYPSVRQWHHIAVTFDGTNSKLYINGKYEGTAPTYYSPAGPSFRLARWYLNDGYHFDGGIKEVKVWSKVLTPVEISHSMYNTNNINKSGNLLYYYKLSEGKGPTLNDYSDNDQHLSNVTGFSWATEDTFSEWIDGEAPTGMYPVIETRTLYYYGDDWYTLADLRMLVEDWDINITNGLIGHYKFDDFQEPTKNVITNTNLDTGWSKGYQTNIIYNEIPPPMEIFDSPVVGFDRGNTAGYWFSYGDYAPQVAGETYTVSLYIKTKDSNFSIRFYTADNAEVGRYWSEYITVPNDGNWHRIVWPSFVNPTDSQSDSLSFNFSYAGAIGDPGTRTWFCAPQMEAKTYVSPFVNGTRSGIVKDYSSKDNNGTLQPATTPKWVKDGKVGEGTYQFGISGWKYILTNASPVGGTLTLCAWVNPTKYPFERSTILQSTNPNGYYLTLANDGSLQSHYYGTTPAGYHSTRGGVIPLNKWTFTCTSWDGNHNRLYINGELLKTVTTTGGGVISASLNIGAESLARQFYGKIDEVRIYNRALSDKEVQYIYLLEN
ncbi:MAG: LamG domain-containing protein [Bacilli bacterium]